MIEPTITNKRSVDNGVLLLKRIEVPELQKSGHQQMMTFQEERMEYMQREGMMLHADEEWRVTFDSVTDMVSIHSNDFKVLKANAAFINALKMKPEDIIGQTCYRLVHGTDQPPPSCPLFKAQQPSTVNFFEPRLGMDLEVTTAPVPDMKEGMPKYVHIMRDITQIPECEREPRQDARTLLAVAEDTIGAIAATVEIRDPYTAGHQLRVSDLAFAIANEMGLSEEQSQPIRLASIVHDIGKIRVPCEILNRPSRISDVEYGMVKMHPFAGYNILKKVRFSWPIADIVLQHHERMDGSGYPAGLRGGNILLEARVLAVADVVEAMSSNRPYRLAPGTYEALKEIAKKAGIEFDTTVVIACLKLFKEKAYEFPEIYNKSINETTGMPNYLIKECRA